MFPWKRCYNIKLGVELHKPAYGVSQGTVLALLLFLSFCHGTSRLAHSSLLPSLSFTNLFMIYKNLLTNLDFSNYSILFFFYFHHNYLLRFWRHKHSHPYWWFWFMFVPAYNSPCLRDSRVVRDRVLYCGIFVVYYSFVFKYTFISTLWDLGSGKVITVGHRGSCPLSLAYLPTYWNVSPGCTGEIKPHLTDISSPWIYSNLARK